MFFTERYDDALDQIAHYRHYPSMKPFIGRQFGAEYPRILILAESHYLPEHSTVHMNATQWYEGNDSELTPKEKAWIATRGILDKPRGGWKARGHAIYRNLESALIEAGLPGEGNVFEHVAYMNAYQRPAKDGDSLKSTALDIERAVETLNAVIAAIEPDNVFFVSRQAQKELGKRLTVSSHGVSHPTTHWWNKRQKRLSNRTGREYFIARIRRYLNGEQP